MSAKHTPGPWRVEWDLPNPVAHIDGGSREDSSAWYRFASVHVMTEDEYGGESFDPIGMANARLIAAAPDSHEANVKTVDALADAFGIHDDWDDERIYDSLPSSAVAAAYFAARAAVLKARGEA